MGAVNLPKEVSKLPKKERQQSFNSGNGIMDLEMELMILFIGQIIKISPVLMIQWVMELLKLKTIGFGNL